jgi:hypothetical protein
MEQKIYKFQVFIDGTEHITIVTRKLIEKISILFINATYDDSYYKIETFIF